MVECPSCKNEVAYKNRFHNYCSECNHLITHTCWNCKEHIDPKKCYESPFTHYHKCPNCGVWAEDEDLDELKKCIKDSKDYLKNNDWEKVCLTADQYTKMLQLVMTLKASQNIRYSCPFGIATTKPQKDFYKFQYGIEKDDEDFVDLFRKVLDFIGSKDIGSVFKATELNESKITNTENIVLVDYFVCLGMLKKIGLLPAKYQVISKVEKKCKYWKKSEEILYCPRCKVEYPKGSIELCDCYSFKKGKHKGQGVMLKLRHKKSCCSCQDKKLNYWSSKREDK